MKTNYRYNVIFFISVITMLNIISKGALAYAATPVMKEFHLNALQWGLINSMYGYGYTAGALVGGILTDLKGTKWTWIWTTVLWGVFVGITGWAGQMGAAILGGSVLAGFYTVRIIFGLAEGPVWAVMNRTVFEWIPLKERGIMTAWTHWSQPFATVITAPLIVWLILATGWKTMFVILGVIAILFAFVWFRYFTNRPEDNPRVNKEELEYIRADAKAIDTSEVHKAPWYAFFTHPGLLLNITGFWSGTYTVYFLMTWLPKYLQDYYHINFASLWYFGMIPWLVPLVTCLWGGKLSDNIVRKQKSFWFGRSGLVACSNIFLAICFFCIPAFQHVSIWAVLIIISLGNGAVWFQNPILWCIIADISSGTEPENVGTYGGWTTFWGQFMSILAPLLTGWLVVTIGYNYIFMPVAALGIIALICTLFIKYPKFVEGAQISSH